MQLKDVATGQFISSEITSNPGDEWFAEVQTHEASVFERLAYNDDDQDFDDPDFAVTFWQSQMLDRHNEEYSESNIYGSVSGLDDGDLDAIDRWLEERYGEVIRLNDIHGYMVPQSQLAEAALDEQCPAVSHAPFRIEEIEWTSREMRRAHLRGTGQQRAPKWQRNYRSNRYARIGERQRQMEMSDWYFGANDDSGPVTAESFLDANASFN